MSKVYIDLQTFHQQAERNGSRTSMRHCLKFPTFFVEFISNITDTKQEQ
jgi:hypothetical protein